MLRVMTFAHPNIIDIFSEVPNCLSVENINSTKLMTLLLPTALRCLPKHERVWSRHPGVSVNSSRLFDFIIFIKCLFK